ncbi:MAG: sigma factor-like helix-turn-helix DNA-binding protein [Methyloceanibacter sp.]|uniref:sigma factor-like helix-turn-helix DNA-binding protein n=1 Tax=Methyloceanibacter sp. TaxID=1965321 RepID=UPI003D9B9F17
MQAEERYDSVRHGLIVMLPRLKRFADVLVGERREGTAFLRRALTRMLNEQHRYQRGTMLDRWAFAEIYRSWLQELRDHADPMGQAKAAEADFERLFLHEDDEDFDPVTASFLGHLPPQQRSTLLLVYAEGFDHEDAGRVLDCSADTISARLVRASASLADRLGSDVQEPASATIETLYPKGQRDDHDRTQ